MIWVQDSGGSDRPWRADGVVVARSDRGWWKVWTLAGDDWRFQPGVYRTADDAKHHAEQLVTS